MARLFEDARDELIGEIVRGRYGEGDLIRLQEIADRFGFSRQVASETIRGLEERGMVSTRHGVGARVQPRERWNPLDEVVLAALLASEHVAVLLGEFLECRRILEVEAATLAAERSTETQVSSLESAFDLMRMRAEEASDDPGAELRYQEADVAFHRDVLLAAGNPALAALTAPIHRALNSTLGTLARPADRFERGLPEHERILDAIRARDPEAARKAMRDHLATVEAYLREFAD